MMKVLALCFVMTTLVTAGVFSPSPELERRHKDDTTDTVVKEGHRVVVVEFDKDDGNTKISISPQEQKGQKLSDEEKLKGEEIPHSHSHRWSAKDLVCDAFGKCKHKIDSAIGRTKEAVSEAVDKANEEAHGAKERVKHVGNEVKEKAHQVVDKGGEEAHWVKERAKDVGSELSTKVKEKAHQVKEGVKREGEKAMECFATAYGILHLLGFATAYGMCVWVTFVSSYVLASSMARQQFAAVQSKIYPVYFKAMAYSVGTALIGYLMSRGMKRSKIATLQGFNLLAPLSMIIVNMLYLEPQATEVMFERMKKEKEDGQAKEGFTGTVPDSAIRGTNGEKSSLSPDPGQERLKEAAEMRSRIIILTEKLKRLNTYSSFLNVVTLMFLTCHLVHLGHQLNTHH